MVQFKIKMFRGISLEILGPVANIKNRYKYAHSEENKDKCLSKNEKDNAGVQLEGGKRG